MLMPHELGKKKKKKRKRKTLCKAKLADTLSRNSKWFMKDLGHEGLNNLLVAYEDKGAKAVCTFGFSQGPGHEPILFQGVTQGRIVPARGPANFGWDPIFEYEGQT